jgi:hypothetical protein
MCGETRANSPTRIICPTRICDAHSSELGHACASIGGSTVLQCLQNRDGHCDNSGRHLLPFPARHSRLASSIAAISPMCSCSSSCGAAWSGDMPAPTPNWKSSSMKLCVYAFSTQISTASSRLRPVMTSVPSTAPCIVKMCCETRSLRAGLSFQPPYGRGSSIRRDITNSRQLPSPPLEGAMGAGSTPAP